MFDSPIILDDSSVTPGANLDALAKDTTPDSLIETFIDTLDIDSIFWKERLTKIANLSVYVCGKVIRIGKKIIEAIVRVAERHPNVAIFVVVGTVLSWFLSHVPLVGWLLALILEGIVITVAGAIILGNEIIDWLSSLFRPIANAQRA